MARLWSGCRKCSGCARCALGPKLSNRCRPEEEDTKEYGILELEEGIVPDRNAKRWEADVTGKECKRLSWHLHLLTAPSAPHGTVFACSRTPRRAMFLCFPFLSTKTQLFWLGLKFFTVLPFLHQSMKAGCTSQRCVTLISFLLDCTGSDLRHLSFIHHCYFFCQLVSFLISFCDIFRTASFPASPGTMRFNVLDLQQYSFLMNSQVGVLCLLGQCTSFLLSTARQ